MLLSILKEQFPPFNDMLNTCASGILFCSTVSFSMLGAIPSTPGDLLSITLFILLATTSGVITNCPNLSPLVQLNFVSGKGNELVSSLVNTELKCLFNSSAITTPCVIIFPALSSSGPTLSRTFCLLLTDCEIVAISASSCSIAFFYSILLIMYAFNVLLLHCIRIGIII